MTASEVTRNPTNDLSVKRIELTEKAKYHINAIGYHVVCLGNVFIEAKAELPYGEFGEWLNEIEVNQSTANKIMKVAREFSDKDSDTCPKVGWRILYEIATLPQEERWKEHTYDYKDSKGSNKHVENKLPEESTLEEIKQLKKQIKAANDRADEAEKKAEQIAKSEQIAQKEIERLSDKVDDLSNAEPSVEYVEIEADTTEYEAEIENLKRQLKDKNDEIDELKSREPEVMSEETFNNIKAISDELILTQDELRSTKEALEFYKYNNRIPNNDKTVTIILNNSLDELAGSLNNINRKFSYMKERKGNFKNIDNSTFNKFAKEANDAIKLMNAINEIVMFDKNQK